MKGKIAKRNNMVGPIHDLEIFIRRLFHRQIIHFSLNLFSKIILIYSEQITMQQKIKLNLMNLIHQLIILIKNHLMVKMKHPKMKKKTKKKDLFLML